MVTSRRPATIEMVSYAASLAVFAFGVCISHGYSEISATAQRSIYGGVTCNQKEAQITCAASATCTGDCTKTSYEAGSQCDAGETHQRNATSGSIKECIQVGTTQEPVNIHCEMPASQNQQQCVSDKGCYCKRFGILGAYTYSCGLKADGTTTITRSPYSETNDCTLP